MPRTTRLVAVAVALAGLLAACGGNSKTTAPTTTSSTVGSSTSDTAAADSTTTTTPSTSVADTTTIAGTTTTLAGGPVAALTGLPVADPSKLNHPALVVKIDNHPQALPQIGLNQADVVYEEIVEGITRFAAVFQSENAKPVGPIRSARTSDLDILAGLSRPLLAWSGGNAYVTGAIRSANLTDVGYGVKAREGGYFRDNRGRKVDVEHTLFADTNALFALAPAGEGPPAPLFTYRSPDDPAPAGDAVGGIKLTMFGTKVRWAWDAKTSTFLRFEDPGYGGRGEVPHKDQAGQQIDPVNVVVEFVGYRQSPADAKSPEAVTVGGGEAWVLTAGVLIKGTWSRPDKAHPAVYKDANGNVIALTPGRTWVELPRANDAAIIPPGVNPSSVAWPRYG